MPQTSTSGANWGRPEPLPREGGSSRTANPQRPWDPSPCPQGTLITFALIASFRWVSTSSAESGGLNEASEARRPLPHTNPSGIPQSTEFQISPLSCLPQNSGRGAASGSQPLWLWLTPPCHTCLALTVQGGHKEVQGLAVERQGGRSVPLLVLLHSLHHQGGLREGRLGVMTPHNTHCEGSSIP